MKATPFACLVSKPSQTAIWRRERHYDEVVSADQPFEAFFLEYVGVYQVSDPEIAIISGQFKPVTILTSNRTRELNDAVRRRCPYHWLDHPERTRELEIIGAQVPRPARPCPSRCSSKLRCWDLKS